LVFRVFSSAEIYPGDENSEMIDFTVHQAFRGKNLSALLLSRMGRRIRAAGMRSHRPGALLRDQHCVCPGRNAHKHLRRVRKHERLVPDAREVTEKTSAGARMGVVPPSGRTLVCRCEWGMEIGLRRSGVSRQRC